MIIGIIAGFFLLVCDCASKGMELTVTGIEDAEAAEEEYIYPVF